MRCEGPRGCGLLVSCQALQCPPPLLGLLGWALEGGGSTWRDLVPLFRISLSVSMGEPLTYHSVMPICRRWERAWLDRPLWFLKNSQRMSGTGSGPEERLRGDGSISEAQKMPVAEAAERFYFPQGLAVPTPSAWPSWPAVGGEQGEGRRQGRRPPQLGQGSAPVWEADLDAVPPAEPVEHFDGGPLASRSLTPRWRRWAQAWLDRPLWVSNQAPQS